MESRRTIKIECLAQDGHPAMLLKSKICDSKTVEEIPRIRRVEIDMPVDGLVTAKLHVVEPEISIHAAVAETIYDLPCHLLDKKIQIGQKFYQLIEIVEQ